MAFSYFRFKYTILFTMADSGSGFGSPDELNAELGDLVEFKREGYKQS